MSDFAWIIFIIIIYLLIIRPMFQGAVNKQPPSPNKGSDINKKPAPSGNANNKNNESDYVDYEEIK